MIVLNSLKNYYKLLESNNDEEFLYKNFIESLKFSKNSIHFNNLINNLIEKNIDFKIIKGFNYLSENNDIKNFRLIIIEIKNKQEEFEEIIKNNFEYSKFNSDNYTLILK